MGNGKVALILDIAGLVEKAGLRVTAYEEEKAVAAAAQVSRGGETQTLLLFDNNTEERFALPLELITRIERVSAEKIERIRERSFMQYEGSQLQLIFLEDHLPVSPPQRDPDATLAVIIPKLVKHPLGIVAGKVYGTISEEVELDSRHIMAPGLFGSAVLAGRITLLPDMYSLFEMAAPELYAEDDRTREERRKTRILLVDDTAFFRMVEAEYLTSAGYEVLVAESGGQALKILEKEKVGGVVLDVIMPGVDGWQVIRAIREDERTRDLPVLAVTSLRDEESREAGLAAGFTDWEAKLNKDRMLEKLAAMLG